MDGVREAVPQRGYAVVREEDTLQAARKLRQPEPHHHEAPVRGDRDGLGRVRDCDQNPLSRSDRAARHDVPHPEAVPVARPGRGGFDADRGQEGSGVGAVRRAGVSGTDPADAAAADECETGHYRQLEA